MYSLLRNGDPVCSTIIFPMTGPETALNLTSPDETASCFPPEDDQS